MDDNGPSGLIPSQTLEEKRKAFVKPEYDYTHKSCESLDYLSINQGPYDALKVLKSLEFHFS